ncbi:hypothetical protein A5821_002204 [Enterococcus sp. 7F3_DIV0205]|uniref:Gram-positive cocci surface proteins LPxTG domain-containing protein n=1 Tax=Candidatus Enterococcus palustris TaxID=1834189 RepID=A0AAQ3W984_9ENTE|nr:LPXTG cell wall anchor domain-containing protein [Enterococcus sp. 7F3_DIV0205]OTN82643.1 hypothetical protein A5821_002554 [Enterococcus sp. 7F3_DIV0205]
MKKLFYSICFSLFCFLLVGGPAVSLASGITSNGGINFTPASQEQTESSEREQQKSDVTTETKADSGVKESNQSKGIFPKTNTDNSHFNTYLGVGLLILCLLIGLARKQQLRNN